MELHRDNKYIKEYTHHCLIAGALLLILNDTINTYVSKIKRPPEILIKLQKHSELLEDLIYKDHGVEYCVEFSKILETHLSIFKTDRIAECLKLFYELNEVSNLLFKARFILFMKVVSIAMKTYKSNINLEDCLPN